MEVCEEKKCSGCGACSNICLKNAITLKENKHGFYFPIIDNKICVECGLCQKTCPINNKINKSEFDILVYAAWNKNKKIRRSSSSGGVFSLLAERVIDNNGIVVGVAWSDDFSTYHRVAKNKKELELLYGSKYVQSNTNQIYNRVKQELKNNVKVLFSGTPCQVHALKCFLDKEYDNLITVDLVCHGVPPYKLFKKYLIEVAGKEENVKNVFLRYKNPYWSTSYVRIEMKNKKNYMQYTGDDSYYNLFNFNYSLRQSCHECKYTSTTRVSDITLSDFWKFRPQNFKMRNYEGGISCVMLNSKKGVNLFEKIKNELVYEESTLEKAVYANHCLSQPFDSPKDVDEFWNDVSNGVSVSKLNKKYIKNPYKAPRALWLRNIKGKYGWILKRVLK